MKKLMTFLLCLSFLATMFSQESKFIRQPAVSPDGSQIAFTYQGDVWVTSIYGGSTKRLTIHEGYDDAPVFSPDGKKLAFVSNRWGNNDIFTIGIDGNGLKRLTYHSADDYTSQWNDNQIYFETRRDFRTVEREAELYTVSENGGTPFRKFDALGFEAQLSPDGNFVLLVRGTCRTAREDYTGPANRDVYLYIIDKDEYIKLTDYKGNDFNPRWIDSRSFYFLSSASGKYNIYKASVDDNGKLKGAPEQLTNYSDFGIRAFGVSDNGGLIAYERKTDIYIKNGKEESVKLDVELGSDYRFDPVQRKSDSKGANQYAVSPNGKLTAFEVAGEIFIKENDKEKSRSINVSNNPYRDQNPTWLSDSTLIYVSDRAGQKDLYLVKSSDEKNTDIFKSLKHETIRITKSNEVDEDWPIVSPDNKKIVFEVGRGKLVVYNIDSDGSLTNEITLLDGWAIPGDVCWSPDSKWLAYSLDDLDFNTEVYIHAADNSKTPVNVSMHPRGDESPVWSKDGSKLGFLSNRNNRDNDVWFVYLSKKDWDKTKQDWEEDEEEPKKKNDKKDDEKEEEDKVDPIVIDFERIHERLVQVTSMPGDEGSIEFSKDGETIFFSAGEPATKGRDLYSIKFDKSDTKRITKSGKNPSRLSINAEGNYIYLITNGGKLARLKNGSEKIESLPFNAKYIVDFEIQKNQMFDEAWFALKEGFYDPNFHGKDWNDLKADYKPMVMKASTLTDFRYMFNIMLGQLNASHMGMYGGGREDTQSDKTGLLGVEIIPVSNGVEVKHVIDESPADRTQSKLNVGDIITAVNGKEVKEYTNFYSMLNGTRNEKVLLSVEGKNGEREVIIRPTNSLSGELYDEWVNERRELVEKYSKGRLGYLHIRAMGWESFERFERELMAAGHGKEGIVIDVRFNGGGWTTDFLLTVLNVRQHAYTVPRGATDNLERDHKKYREHYAFGERLPYAWLTKPSITLCNENSYSNAEIFSHAYKTLGHGTLVGKPTFGAVISTGGRGLIDGSYVRMPFRAWYVKATDENMEWGPAVPDIEVDNSPDYRAKGVDEQLKKSVETLLQQLDK